MSRGVVAPEARKSRRRAPEARKRNISGVGAAAVWIAWLLSGGMAHALDPEKAVHQYRLDVWQPEQGLPWGSVGPVLQTSDGYLWLGSYEGLARFDGVRFEVFDTTTTPALGDNNVHALAEDSGGGLWIGTDGGGVVHLADGVFTSYTTRQGLVHDRVTDLLAGSDGGLWVATRGGLSQIRNQRIESWLPGEGLPHQRLWTLEEDSGGGLWIGTDESLFRLQDGSFVRQPVEVCSDCGVSALYRDPGGNLWVGTYGGHLLRFDGGAAAAHWSLPETDIDVMAIREDAEGNLWIATYGGGLFRLQGGELTSLGEGDGLTSDTVWMLEEDAEGSLWLGTEGGGLLRLRDTPVTSITARDGLPHDRVWVVHADRAGRLWAGTDGGLAKWENGELTTYTTRDGLASDTVTAFGDRPDGSLWVGTYEGLNLWRDGRLSAALPDENVAISAIYEDSRKDLWLGTEERGLLYVHDGTTRSLSMADGLPADTVKVLAGDRDGTLWIGTDGGLARLWGGDPTTLTQVGGLAGAFVRSIYIDPEDTLWIGTRGSGLFRLRDGELTGYTTQDGLFSDVVYQILEDGQRNLWMSCNKGVFQISKEELDALARGMTSGVHATVYGASAGMKSVEGVGESQPAGTRTADGRLWFPTAKGLAVIDPENLKRNLRPPPVIIEQVLYDGAVVDVPASDPVVLPPGRRALEVDYTALSLVDPERTRFRYRLVGYDDAWVEAGGRRSTLYTNLTPGSYRFQVIASNNDGVWNEAGAAVELYLRPAFYETWPFYAVCVLVIGLLARGILRFRVRRLERHNAELRQMQRRLQAKNAEVEAKNAEVEAKNVEVEAKNAEVQRFTRRFTRATVANSEAVKAQIVAGEGLDPERVAVIGNGVDHRRFRPGDRRAARRRLGVDDGTLLVGSVGRLSAAKGFEHLLAAIAAAPATAPDGSRVELALVGDGPRRQALEALARQLGIGDRVRFLGRREGLERIYPAFDVFVLSSLREGSPNVLYEAMACGVASVATDVGGVAEIVAPKARQRNTGASCLVIPPADAGAIATALGRLAGDPSLRRRLGAAARERVEAELTIEKMIERHQALYQRLLAPSGGSE